MCSLRKLALLALLLGGGLSVEGAQCHLLLLGAGTCGAATPSPLLTNLVAYWEQNDAADADSTDAHNLSCGGGCDLAESASDTIASTTGKVGNARDYELGDTEHHFRADHADLSGTDGDKTWTAWAQLESLVTGTLVSKWVSGGDQREFHITYNATSTAFQCVLSSSGAAGTITTLTGTNFGAATAGDGSWYFVSCRYDATADEITLDVNEDADGPNTAAHVGGVFNGSAPFRIGNIANDTQYFDGLIDEVGFWTRELTDAEITWLYNSGNGRSYADIVACSGC